MSDLIVTSLKPAGSEQTVGAVKADGSADPGAPGPAREPFRSSMVFQSLFALALKGGGVVLAFASQIVVARSLGVEAFGIYVTVLIWATLLSLVAGMGLPQAGVRFFATYAERAEWSQYRAYLRSAVRLVVLTGLAAGIAALGIFAALPALRTALPAMAVGVLLVVLFGGSTLANGALLAAHRPFMGELGNTVARAILVMVLVGGAAVAFPPLPVEAALALTVLASLLVLILQAGVWWRATGTHWRGPAQYGERAMWLRSGGAFLTATLAFALVERLDTILIASLASPAQAGPYSVASRLVLLVSVALTPISALAGPRAARLLARHDHDGLQRLMGQTALLYAGAGGVLSVGLVLAAPLLLGAFGPGFQDARPLVLVLMVGQVALAFAGPAGGLLAIAGHNRALVRIMLATAAADLLFCLILIPQYGPAGAAVATSLALAGNAVALAIAARLILRIDTTLVAGIRLLLRR